MSDHESQNFSTHRSIDKFFALQGLLLLVGLVMAGISFFKFNTHTGWCLLATAVSLHALVAVTILFKMRLYTLRVQDRVIRLEMAVRLGRVLSGDLAERARALKMGQLISLRFASDEELSALVEKVLSEDIKKRDEIKKLVKDWQPDHDRI